MGEGIIYRGTLEFLSAKAAYLMREQIAYLLNVLYKNTVIEDINMQYDYTISLYHSALSPSMSQEAELGYRQALELTLGGVEGVMRTWRAWQDAEHTLGSLSAETWKVARQWLIPADSARQIALQGIAGAEDAYFEVQRVPSGK